MSQSIRHVFYTLGRINVVIGIVIFFLVIKYIPELDSSTRIAIAGVLATVAGILSGFSLAAITMLVGMTGNRVIINLKKSDMFSELLNILNMNSVSLVIVSTLSLLSMFMGSVIIKEYNFSWIFLCISLSMMVTLVGSFINSWRKISLVIKAISKV
ncbi:hypothetical protein JD541_09295 [Aeromonas dhakensis]|uniref:hypothetical protein n=1 Tax=Aeromonas TaxID=642 RepID=UPI00191E3204|nr:MULTISPECIES: hypothetical protein [Aeromonas]MBL0533170.1 hypothetical protein [Aeromonas dhakensis]MDY7764447.1 hypothetical protein [Aeromonas caviae]